MPAHDVDAAGVTFDAELPSAWLDAELAELGVTARAPGKVTARLSRSGEDIVVRGRVHAALTTPCARCLDPAAIDVDAELSLFLKVEAPAKHGAAGKPAAKPASSAHAPEKTGRVGGHAQTPAAHAPKGKAKDEEYEFSAGEADVDTYDGETVVLDGFVREALLLEVPNFPLCSEGCPGIRSAAASAPEAAAPHVDPRLAPLAALRGLVREGGAPAPPQKKKKE